MRSFMKIKFKDTVLAQKFVVSAPRGLTGLIIAGVGRNFAATTKIW